MLMMLDLMKGYELDLLMKRQNLGGENVYQSPPSKLPHRLALLVSCRYNNYCKRYDITKEHLLAHGNACFFNVQFKTLAFIKTLVQIVLTPWQI